MDFNIEVRRKQLEHLDQFISSSKDRVNSILDYLGWSSEKINESHKEMVNCIYDQDHRIPASKAAKHMQECSFRKEGYEKNEKYLSEPNFIPGTTILLDETTKVQVLNQALAKNPRMKTGWRSGEPNPKTSDRIFSVYSKDERLALYNFAIASTSGPPKVPEFNITESKQEQRDLTEADIKKMERDSKRRRIKYKAKSVHTSRKTTTEIMREVISGQMEAYEEWLKHEINLETSSVSTSIKQEPSSPQSSTKLSYEEERTNGLSHSHRSLSKESSQSKYYENRKHKRSTHRSHEGTPRDAHHEYYEGVSNKRTDRYEQHTSSHHSRENSPRKKDYLPKTTTPEKENSIHHSQVSSPSIKQEPYDEYVSNNVQEREISAPHSSDYSPKRKRHREYYKEHYSSKRYDYRNDKEKYRRYTQEHNDRYMNDYRHEKEKHRSYKREYYEERSHHSRSHYEDRHRRYRSREEYERAHKYREDYREKYYEDRNNITVKEEEN